MNPIEILKLSDPKLKDILYDFRGSKNIYKHISLDPQNTIHTPTHLAFEVIDKKNWRRPFLLKRWLIAMKPLSLSSSVTPALVTFLVGNYLELKADLFTFIFSLLGVICIHLGVNFLNIFDDHMGLIENLSLKGTRSAQGSDVICKSWIPARHLRQAGFFSLILGILFGLPAVYKNPLEIGAIGAIGILGAFGYSGWPLRLKYKALGDGAVVLLLGPCVVIGTSLATFGIVPLSALIAGVFFGFLAETTLFSTNLKAIPLDTNRNVKTLAQGFGFKTAKIFLVWVYLTSYGLILIFSWSLKTIYPVIAITLMGPFVVDFLNKVLRADGPLSSSLKNLKQKAEAIHLVSSLLLIITLILISK
ncbi:MAG: prenyltransferase [Oligoflexia bacterium]|nr:prenyltransferase [Oligoflexia bacterium]